LLLPLCQQIFFFHLDDFPDRRYTFFRRFFMNALPIPVREIAFDYDAFYKEAALIGSKGWIWDTDMNSAQNLGGWGNLLGSAAGSIAGAGAGTYLAPGVGTVLGGAAGSVGGGFLGRGIGHAIGTGIDWFTGQKPAANPDGTARSFLGDAKDDLLGNAVTGLIPGAGKLLRPEGSALIAGGKYMLGTAGKRALQRGLGQTLNSGWNAGARIAQQNAVRAAETLGMKATNSAARNFGIGLRSTIGSPSTAFKSVTGFAPSKKLIAGGGLALAGGSAALDYLAPADPKPKNYYDPSQFAANHQIGFTHATQPLYS
jgi:hypothetical protein